jgi:hypothetical protein
VNRLRVFRFFVLIAHSYFSISSWAQLEQTVPSLVEDSVVCARNLRSRNHSPQFSATDSDVDMVDFDFVGIWLSHGLNPFKLRFEFDRPPTRLFRIRAVYDGAVVGSAEAYKDPYRGGTYASPELDEGIRGMGLGQALYFALARILWIEHGIQLSSNAQQLTPAAENVWKRLQARGLAVQLGTKLYQLTTATLNSEAVIGVTSFILKTQASPQYWQEVMAADPDPNFGRIAPRN